MSALLDELREAEVKRMDYVGFTFDSIHSSQLKILSVSDGSRYSKDLLPTIEDYSIDIVGGYGANYFGGTFKKRDIVLNIAFDQVQEEELMAIREWLGDREVHELFFDENPFKVYHAVVSKTPTIKYIAFGDVGTRVYKGEGSITFTCYDPIARSLNGNYLEDYDWENIEEWALASGMLDSKDGYDENKKFVKNYYDTPITEGNKQIIHAYNAGILPTPFKMYITWTGTELEIKNTTTSKSLKLNRTSTNEEYILIDTERSVALEMSGVSKSTLPEADTNELGKIYRYTGATTEDYTQNKYYICEKQEQYGWETIGNVSFMNINTTNDFSNVDAPLEDDIYYYTGATTENYTTGTFYKYIYDYETEQYIWEAFNPVTNIVQTSEMPAASPEDNTVYYYTGENTGNYNHNTFYEYINDSWQVAIFEYNRIYYYTGQTTANYIHNTYYKYIDSLTSTIFVTNVEQLRVDSAFENQYCHYIGTTNDNYTHDAYYKLVINNNIYQWQLADFSNTTEIPEAQKNILNEKFLYLSASTDDYVQNTIYKCVRLNDIYVWKLTSNPELSETKVILNQLVETGRFFTLEKGLNELEITGGTVTKFEFYHRYL